MDDVEVASSATMRRILAKNRTIKKNIAKQIRLGNISHMNFPILQLSQAKHWPGRYKLVRYDTCKAFMGWDEDGQPVERNYDESEVPADTPSMLTESTSENGIDPDDLSIAPEDDEEEEEAAAEEEEDDDDNEDVDDEEDHTSADEAYFTPPLKYSGVKASPKALMPSPVTSLGSPKSPRLRKSPMASPKAAVASPKSPMASPKAAVASPKSPMASPKPAAFASPKPSAMASPKPAMASPKPSLASPKSPNVSATSPMPPTATPISSPQQKTKSPKASPTEQVTPITILDSPTVATPDDTSTEPPIGSPTTKTASPTSKPDSASPKSDVSKHIVAEIGQPTDTPPIAHIVADEMETATVEATPPASTASTQSQSKTAKSKSKSTKTAAAPSSAASPLKPLAPHDDFYKKPFDFGWRRELVWRANMETAKEKADVYFITPGGKKLRTRNEIMPYLSDGPLTIDHFCFSREPVGAAPEFETVRNAKPSSRTLMAQTTPPTPPVAQPMGKRVSKPKGPKGASPPPEGWTPTRALKVNNAALLSTAAANRYTGSLSQAVTPPPKRAEASASGGAGETAKKAKSKKIPKNMENSHSTASATSGGGAASPAVNKKKRSRSISSNTSLTERPAKLMAIADTNTLAATAAAPLISNNNNNNKQASAAATHEPCTNKCLKGGGQMPQLQCVKCLCLYHHECVGLARQDCEYRTLEQLGGKDYICEACLPPPAKAKDSSKKRHGTDVRTQQKATPKRPTPAPKTAREGAKTAVNCFTQELAVIRGKRYVVLKQPINQEETKSAENTLRKLKEDSNRKLTPLKVDANAEQAIAVAAAVRVAVEKVKREQYSRMFTDASYVYSSLVRVFKYLKVHERPSASSVCKMWNAAYKDTSLWTTVLLKNSKINSWSGFATFMRARQTRHLDMRKMLQTPRVDEMWNDFSKHIGKASTLETIDFCRCPVKVIENLFKTNRNIRVLNALSITNDQLNVSDIDGMPKLRELRLRTIEQATLSSTLRPIAQLVHLEHLSLTGLKKLNIDDLELLREMSMLRSLELGDCGHFDERFSAKVLPHLRQLARLRLENGQEAACDTLAILAACCRLTKLHQLELVNFDIKPGFDDKLEQCTHIDKLLIIPTYISQSATTNHIVLSAVQRAADTLKVFTWGVTQELLRVTALYVGQCDETMRKEKYMFNECIPVLKPVPRLHCHDDEADDVEAAGQKAADDQTDEQTDAGGTVSVPQIEILPLEKVESILEHNLPNTKFTIVKMPYAFTWKQHLVE